MVEVRGDNSRCICSYIFPCDLGRFEHNRVVTFGDSATDAGRAYRLSNGSWSVATYPSIQ